MEAEGGFWDPAPILDVEISKGRDGRDDPRPARI